MQLKTMLTATPMQTADRGSLRNTLTVAPATMAMMILKMILILETMRTCMHCVPSLVRVMRVMKKTVRAMSVE